MESPEMMELSDQATEYENQIENLQDDIATMQKAVEKEYE
jgi:prefoldin subunit 5